MYSKNASEKKKKILPIVCVNKCNKILKLQHPIETSCRRIYFSSFHAINFPVLPTYVFIKIKVQPIQFLWQIQREVAIIIQRKLQMQCMHGQ